MPLTIQQAIAELRKKHVAVLGLGVSNTPLIKMLLRAGVEVLACDRKVRAELSGRDEELESLGATLCLGEDYLDHLQGQDVIFRTPGLHPDTPQLAAARQRGSIITSEMELFFRVCPCKIIAVTGSDGKTTTTTIISEFLKAAGHTVYLGGNIGRPLLADVDGMFPEDIVVLELSSFQLMTMTHSPDIAVVTNVSPNHLDVHKSMGEYISAKENILKYQSPDGCAVLNYDNEITRAFAKSAVGTVRFFGRSEALQHGIVVRDGAICDTGGDAARTVLPLSDLLLPGAHNVENYMAAIAAVQGMVSDEVVRSVAKRFAGVEHRIELVRTLHGVRYYNDSIASSPTRTIAGLRSFPQKVILIAGGYDKQIPFTELGAEITEHVKYLYLTGDTAPKIRAAVEQAPGYDPQALPIAVIGDFTQAVLAAHMAAQPGDVVLLSPACASFDHFANFAARGEAFKKIIYGL